MIEKPLDHFFSRQGSFIFNVGERLQLGIEVRNVRLIFLLVDETSEISELGHNEINEKFIC